MDGHAQEQKEEITDAFRYTTYLVGAMQITAEKDGGGAKRAALDAALRARNIYPINPVTLEASKTGVTTEDLTVKMKGWIASGNWEKFAEQSNSIWKGHTYVAEDASLIHVPGDIEYVKMSDWITFLLHAGDSPCVAKGTMVLMADGTLKAIEQVRVGDYVFGFKKERGRTTLVKTKVYQAVRSGCKKCIKVSSDKGSIVVTPDHPFLTRNKKHGSVYTPVASIDNGFAMRVGEVNKTFLKGWIAGYFQHDGNFFENWRKHSATCLSDRKEEILRVVEVCKELGIRAHMAISVRDGRAYYMAAVSSIFDYYRLKNICVNHPPFIDFKRGWVAGAIDADGYYERESIRYTQSVVHDRNIAQFEDYLRALQITYNKQVRKGRKSVIRGREVWGSNEVTICLPKSMAFFIPSQLEYKLERLTMGISTLSTPLQHKNLAARRTVYDLSTGTGNFVANGFIVHNCGSFAECGIAMEHDIPIYLITDIPKRELRQSLLQMIMVTGGEVFRSEKEYLDFIDKKYGVKADAS